MSAQKLSYLFDGAALGPPFPGSFDDLMDLYVALHAPHRRGEVLTKFTSFNLGREIARRKKN